MSTAFGIPVVWILYGGREFIEHNHCVNRQLDRGATRSGNASVDRSGKLAFSETLPSPYRNATGCRSSSAAGTLPLSQEHLLE